MPLARCWGSAHGAAWASLGYSCAGLHPASARNTICLSGALALERPLFGRFSGTRRPRHRAEWGPSGAPIGQSVEQMPPRAKAATLKRRLMATSGRLCLRVRARSLLPRQGHRESRVRPGGRAPSVQVTAGRAGGQQTRIAGTCVVYVCGSEFVHSQATLRSTYSNPSASTRRSTSCWLGVARVWLVRGHFRKINKSEFGPNWVDLAPNLSAFDQSVSKSTQAGRPKFGQCVCVYVCASVRHIGSSRVSGLCRAHLRALPETVAPAAHGPVPVGLVSQGCARLGGLRCARSSSCCCC